MYSSFSSEKPQRPTSETPLEFFHDEVCRALEHQRLRPSEHTSWYLVQLLAAFIQPKEMFDRAGVDPDRPLAEIFLEGLRCESVRRGALLKLTGDLALFMSGFLSESLVRRSVGPGYYMRLGGSAYQVASRESRIAAAEVYLELAENFVRFADVLSEISARAALTDQQNLLRLYERWLETGSSQSAEILREQGICVVPVSRQTH